MVDSTDPPVISLWPVLLAQWSVALMFFNAAFWKMRSDHFHLGWALSDNFRNTLILRSCAIAVMSLEKSYVAHAKRASPQMR